MKRDMDLIRKIVLFVEAMEPNQQIEDESVQIEGYEPSVINYHIGLLAEAELIKSHDVSDSGGDHWLIDRLTWKGHEFIDSARNESVWSRAKEMIKEKGGSIPFEVMQTLLTSIAKSMLGIT
ncbi:MAG TPA: DUF2513 domain-containing protein [bacterium]